MSFTLYVSIMIMHFVALLEKKFASSLNFQVKFTHWRWRHSKKLDGKISLLETSCRFQRSNWFCLIGFAEALWEQARTDTIKILENKKVLGQNGHFCLYWFIWNCTNKLWAMQMWGCPVPLLSHVLNFTSTESHRK